MNLRQLGDEVVGVGELGSLDHAGVGADLGAIPAHDVNLTRKSGLFVRVRGCVLCLRRVIWCCRYAPNRGRRPHCVTNARLQTLWLHA